VNPYVLFTRPIRRGTEFGFYFKFVMVLNGIEEIGHFGYFLKLLNAKGETKF
jgi:hypothetical protein